MSKGEKDKIKEYQRTRYQQLIQYKKEASQNRKVLFLLSMRMSGKTLNFDNIRVNKREFHKSKQPINLDFINVGQIVVSDKFRHNDDGFNYFIGYKEGEIVKPLCIILLQMNAYIKCFGSGGKNMSFIIKDDDVLDKYDEIWDKIKGKLNIKFHSIPDYDEKYMKAKVREFNGVIKTNFSDDKIPKENMHYTSIACITIDSVMRMEKKNYPQVYLEECKYRMKKTKMTKFIEAELESESELESDIELELKSELESDTD